MALQSSKSIPLLGGTFRDQLCLHVHALPPIDRLRATNHSQKDFFGSRCICTWNFYSMQLLSPLAQSRIINRPKTSGKSTKWQACVYFCCAHTSRVRSSCFRLENVQIILAEVGVVMFMCFTAAFFFFW